MENGSQFATKVDLSEMETRLALRFEGRMDGLEQRIADRITEAIRDSETRMLQAFYSFAQTTQSHLR
jgi:hypothetical protein